MNPFDMLIQGLHMRISDTPQCTWSMRWTSGCTTYSVFRVVASYTLHTSSGFTRIYRCRARDNTCFESTDISLIHYQHQRYQT